jgi:hypothetical protein
VLAAAPILVAAPAQVILTAPAVIVGAGQKVIIRTSVQYNAGSLANGTNRNITQLITDTTPTTYDTSLQSINISESHVVDRVIELSGLVGSFTFQVRANVDIAINPTVTPAHLSMVVMVVSV